MDMKVELTLTEEMLGTATANPELYAEFLANQATAAEQDEEVASLPDLAELMEKGTTVFRVDEHGCPAIMDYMVKGFFKDACGMLRRVKGSQSAALKAYKKVIDGLVFVAPRFIPLVMPEGAEIGHCTRPLRAQTAQGDRVALSRSESVPAGTTLTFTVNLLDPALEDAVAEWLDYGKLRGIGQWRNSGKGSFTWERVD